MALPLRSNTDRRGCQHTDTRVEAVVLTEAEFLKDELASVQLVCRGCGATYSATAGEWRPL